MNKIDAAVHLLAPMLVNASLKKDDLEAYVEAARYREICGSK